MRFRVLLVLVAVCAALMATQSFARDTCYVATDTCYVCRSLEWGDFGAITELDFGACDTVRIGCPVYVNDLAVGDSFQVPIYLYNDAPLGGFSLPFRHYGRNLRFSPDGLDPTDGTVLTSIQQAGLQFLTDDKSDTASALVGWIDITGRRPIAANTTGAAKLLGNLYLVLTDTIHEVVRFDTVFYPPAGRFLLSTTIGTSVYPQFAHCPQGDIILGDTPCGDADGSRHINIADVVYMINYIFRHGAPPQDASGGDVDCDLSVTIADVIYLINYIFVAGPKPCLGCQ